MSIKFQKTFSKGSCIQRERERKREREQREKREIERDMEDKRVKKLSRGKLFER